MSVPGPLFSLGRLSSLAVGAPAPARVVGRSRLPFPSCGRRAISQSAASQKALPFSLNSARSETAAGSGQGRVLRMVMFGAFACCVVVSVSVSVSVFWTFWMHARDARMA